MKITIRKALKEDMKDVLSLIEELALFEKEPDAVEVTVANLQEDGFGASPKFTCWVAEVDKQVVGMALVYFRYSTWKGKTVHLEDLVVRDNMRGKGVGEALYAEVMKYGHSQGVKRVQWEVIAWNEGAIKFYERSGAKVLRDWHVVHMDEQGLTNYIEKE
ncbi:GNAT family N-acetyltransferase [Ulvibacter litoralis]|uniref:Ribosomal protein S18 acetylase RimI n=1 Tax=Ulvibacter litoralis TaxID=227084 RepID=A0A1G7DK24_9FLAO|nr:GNAT family N-acetyltransferase [Ulvibacter litoralis]GHC43140.1 N-acetyltransferase [Ulvibacter litoralis]SDE51871.1 Ribosomal protein S18 acetylase RimI [Ulvibacter litoralis]